MTILMAPLKMVIHQVRTPHTRPCRQPTPAWNHSEHSQTAASLTQNILQIVVKYCTIRIYTE